MSEISQMRTENLFKYPDSTINGAFRNAMGDLQDILGLMMGAASVDSKVAGFSGVGAGFNVVGFGNLNVEIGEGYALVLNLAAPEVDGQSQWELYLTRVPTTISFQAADAFDRTDLISMATETVNFEEQTLPKVGGTTDDVFTRRGVQTTFTVTKGVDTNAPATPAGHVSLYEVFVPAGETASEFFSFVRSYPVGASLTTRGVPLFFLDTKLVTQSELLKISTKTSGNGGFGTSRVAYGIKRGFLDLPYFSRPVEAGKTDGDHIFVVIPDPEGKYRITASPWGAMEDLGGQIKRAVWDTQAKGPKYITDAGGAGILRVPFSLPSRGTKLLEAGMFFHVSLAVPTSIVLTFYHYDAATGISNQLGTAISNAPAIGKHELGVALINAPVLGDGDSFFAYITIIIDTIAAVEIASTWVQVQEGKKTV